MKFRNILSGKWPASGNHFQIPAGFSRALLAGALLPLSMYSSEANGQELVSLPPALVIRELGTYDTGAADLEEELTAAEISAYDAVNQVLYTTNFTENSIDIVDLRDPQHPAFIRRVAMTNIVDGWTAGGMNSVSLYGNKLAVALEPTDKQAEVGKVVILDTNVLLSQMQILMSSDQLQALPGSPVLATVDCGFLPDMVTFNKDGSKIVVANEGEPGDDYSVDPEGSITIINAATYAATHLNFQSYNGQEATLRNQGIRIFGNDYQSTAAQDLEPEYVAISPDNTKAFVTLQENNAVAVVNLTNDTLETIYALGDKDLSTGAENQFDFSNKDDLLGNFKNWPVKALYLPDSIASFEADGVTYFVTANEGDARDYEGYTEEFRVKDHSDPEEAYKLDTYIFGPYIENGLLENENLGRLKTTITGDTDMDGDQDIIYTYSTRSFSIWNGATGEQVFDSNNTFSKLMRELIPEEFNTNPEDVGPLADGADGRSDDKGVEPEALTVGTISGRQLAFVGMERGSGGVLVYDITNPAEASLVTYIRREGDRAPEGLIFQSTGEDSGLLLVSNEVSGTVSAFNLSFSNDLGEIDHAGNISIGYISGMMPEGAQVKWTVNGATPQNARFASSYGSMMLFDSSAYNDQEELLIKGTVTNASGALIGTSEVVGEFSQSATLDQMLMVKQLGTYFSGTADLEEELTAAEISAYHPGLKRLYTTNFTLNTLDLVDASNPEQPGLIKRIDVTELTDGWAGGMNSVAIYGDTVALALEPQDKQAEVGKLAILNTDGELQRLIDCGYLPDMVTFNKDGSKILVANEGEPSDDYTIDPEGSITIIETADYSTKTIDFKAFDGMEETLRAEGIRIFGNNYQASASQDLEPEYIAVSPDNTKAFVTLQENNAVALIDLQNDELVEIFPLGTKDLSSGEENQFDLSNKDGQLGNFQNWPVQALYLPDSIASFEADGKTYFVTANEGDARDYDGYSEEYRVKDHNDPDEAYKLDPVIFADVIANHLDDADLGRLKTTITGDTDMDGDQDIIYTYSARSFSIWDGETGEQVFDSGNDFSRLLYALAPEEFNTNPEDPGELSESADSRSDDKGAEPEAITIGELNGRTLAFIGMERGSGGVMIYDITIPAEATFVTYIRREGDRAPEGLIFQPAEDGQSGLLFVSNEVSGTVSAFELTYPGESFGVIDQMSNVSVGIPASAVPTDGQVTWTVNGYEVGDYRIGSRDLVARTNTGVKGGNMVFFRNESAYAPFDLREVPEAGFEISAEVRTELNGLAAELSTEGTLREAVELYLDKGWNLIGSPVVGWKTNNLADYDVTAYTRVNGVYREVLLNDTFENGRGYWVYVDDEVDTYLKGERSADTSFPVESGWTLISPVELTPASDLNFAAGELYYWDTEAGDYYRMDGDDDLEPTVGYWGYVDGDQTIALLTQAQVSGVSVLANQLRVQISPLARFNQLYASIYDRKNRRWVAEDLALNPQVDTVRGDGGTTYVLDGVELDETGQYAVNFYAMGQQGDRTPGIKVQLEGTTVSTTEYNKVMASADITLGVEQVTVNFTMDAPAGVAYQVKYFGETGYLGEDTMETGQEAVAMNQATLSLTIPQGATKAYLSIRALDGADQAVSDWRTHKLASLTVAID